MLNLTEVPGVVEHGRRSSRLAQGSPADATGQSAWLTVSERRTAGTERAASETSLVQRQGRALYALRR
jgi:hypothetical protein